MPHAFPTSAQLATTVGLIDRARRTQAQARAHVREVAIARAALRSAAAEARVLREEAAAAVRHDRSHRWRPPVRDATVDAEPDDAGDGTARRLRGC